MFISIKEDDLVTIDPTSYIIQEKALAAKVVEKDEWFINSGCSHHMIGDKIKFVSMEKYDVGLVRFGDDKASIMWWRFYFF